MSWAFAISLISTLCHFATHPATTANAGVEKTRMFIGPANIRGCSMAKQIIANSSCDHAHHAVHEDCLEIRRKVEHLNYDCARDSSPARGEAETITGTKVDSKLEGPENAKIKTDDRLASTNKKSSPPSDGQLGAFERGTNAVDAGISDNAATAAEVNSGISLSRDLKMNQLESAMAALEGIQNSYASPTQIPIDVQRKLQYDQELLTEAMQRTEKNEPFDMAKAQSANFPEVKASLELAAAAAYLENQFSKEKEYLVEQGVVFASMYNQLNESKSGLVSESYAEMMAPGKRPAPSISNKLAPNKLGKKLDPSNISPQSKDTTALAQELAKVQKADPNAPIAKMNITELQKKLREKLTEIKKSKREKESLAAFAGDLGNGNLGELVKNPTGKTNEMDPLESLKQTFSLEGIETDQEVRRIQEEGARELASSSGILLIDSKDLFERVHEYHRACLKKECVK